MIHLPWGSTALEKFKYHIQPDVLRMFGVDIMDHYPDVEAWAEAYDSNCILQDAVETLVGECASKEPNIYSALTDALNIASDELDVTQALNAIDGAASYHGELVDFFEACNERLDEPTNKPDAGGPDDTQRIFDAITLGEKVRVLRDLKLIIKSGDMSVTEEYQTLLNELEVI